MTQQERRIFLITALLKEEPKYKDMDIPKNTSEQKRLLRTLFNLRMPKKAGKDFIQIQDEYLREEIAGKGITDYGSIAPLKEGIYLWRGDITTLRCDAIVNAANSQMLGCFCPCHGCIDNAIHTYAGIELRFACAQLMNEQQCGESTGKAKITLAYNLPGKYVIHTVGPIVRGKLTKNDEEQLSSCYISCLELAEKNNVKSIAFCCISTGEFHFPNDKAAKIAVDTVQEYKKKTNSKIEVIFNVFKQIDYEIYRELLG
ncbi:MAG: protein-ADP-ribose hydrolase [Lachnospiraceae bacterium]|nr:protein-ADP-ribose hydrolase [Lachnospiraceae bacterium]